MGMGRIKEDATMKNLKNTAGWLVMAAALTLGLSACSSSEDSIIEQPVNPTQKTYTMTITASKGDGAMTRALTYDGNTKTINAAWTEGEKVYVYNHTKDKALDGYLEAKDDGASVTLEGDLTGTVEKDDELYLGFPQLDEYYTGQNGTLTKIASTYDYALGWAKVTDVTGGKITAEDCYYGGNTIQLDNQQAIVKFTLLNKADNSAIDAMSLTIDAKDGSSNAKLIQTLDFASSEATYGPITISPVPATNVIYAALATDDSDDSDVSNASYDYTLTATTADGETYTYTKEGVMFKWGNYYEITVKMTRQPRTYDLSQATSSVTLKNGDTATGTMPTGMVYIASGAEVTLSDVTVTNGISCNGSATINLEGANTVGGSGRCGIEIGRGTLTIQGSGSLTATGSHGGAGIGGSSSNCHVVIKGGTIVAQGSALDSSLCGAGIGGYGYAFGNITIEGGDVTATGGNNAAGIGGGHAGTSICGNISISGGTVRATGGANAAGIGCGYADISTTSTCGDITISGGTVEATAGTITNGSYYISAIGIAATSIFRIGTVTVTDGINSVAMTNTNSIVQGNNNNIGIAYFIYGNLLKIGTNTNVNTNGYVGDYGFGTVRSSWNSSTKTWTLTKTGS